MMPAAGLPAQSESACVYPHHSMSMHPRPSVPHKSSRACGRVQWRS